MLGSANLTGTTAEQKATVPGMAHFSGTGPPNAACKDCRFKGYRHEYPTREKVNSQTGEVTEYTPGKWSNGCAKNYEMTGRKKITPDVPDYTSACKYFERKVTK